MDDARKRTINRSLLAEVMRRRRHTMLNMIASWEAEEGPIDREHLDWAEAALDHQGSIVDHRRGPAYSGR